MINFKDKKVGILGLGEENIALVKYLVGIGAQNITICDRKSREELGEYYRQVEDLPAEFRLGPDYLDNLNQFDIIFRTPGLPYLEPKIQRAKENGVEISSQTKLFFDLCPSPIIGITGTKGKGTTASLIYKILANSSQLTANSKKAVSRQPSAVSRIYLGGNIGNPPIEFLDKLTKDDIVVLELSSFQLQDLTKSPHIAVVLDIKVDHLDVHKNEDEYIEAKRNIVKYQTKDDFAVVNADYLTSVDFATLSLGQTYWFSRKKSVDLGTFVIGDQIILRDENDQYPIIKKDEIQLRGEHNLENICAAVTAGYLAGADTDSIKNAVKDFKGLEHRLEFVRTLDGVKFYNDSFSTTPDTTIAALKSFSQPIILLLGGSEKNADYQELIKTIAKKNIKLIISIGSTAKRIVSEIGEIKSMPEAVKIAKEKAENGDVILLSPASASFDHFRNYKERGEIFKEEVLRL